MTTIQAIASKAEKLTSKMDHRARLLSVLGDGREWKYDGEVIDCGANGKCACGHKIRDGYIVHKKGEDKTCILGSSCINIFEGVNPETFAALSSAVQAKSEELAAAKKAAKAVTDEAEIAALRAQFTAARDEVFARFSSYPRGCAPRALWEAVEGWNRLPRSVPAYRQKAAAKKWLIEHAAKWKQFA